MRAADSAVSEAALDARPCVEAIARPRSDALVLVSLFAVLLVGELNVHLISPLLPAIAGDLSVDVGTAGALVAAYSFAAAGSALVVGPLSDVWGRLPFIRVAIGVFVVSFSLTAVVSSFPALLALRALSGLAAGALSTTVTTYAGDYFPYIRRGRAFGLITTASFVALGVGVPAGAALASAAGWRSVFGALLALTLVVVPAALCLPRPPTGALRLGRGADGARRRSVTPQRYRAFFITPSTLFGLLAAFFVSGGLLGFVTYLGAWLTRERGVPLASVGLLFTAAAVASLVVAPVAGLLADRAGKRPVALVASVALGVSFLIVPAVGWGVPMVAAFSLMACAAAFRQGPLSALITELVETEHRGSYVAMRNSASQLGIAAAVLVGGVVYEWAGFGGVAIMSAAMSTLAAICLMGIDEPDIVIAGHR